MKKQNYDIAKIREDINNANQDNFWRSIDELAKTDEFNAYLKEEYPHSSVPETETDESGVSRRDFLKLMGASLLMTSISGCSQPLEKIVPYVSQPEEIIPGKPLYFATSIDFNGHSTGLLVESHMGRPTKIEGNPQHTDSLGATNAIAQASVLGLYDPDRSKQILSQNNPSTLGSFEGFINDTLKDSDGTGVSLLTNRVISPTLGSQIKAFLKKHPNAAWHQYDPVNVDLARQAQLDSFGKFVDTVYAFDKAKVVFSIGSDFLNNTPGSLRYAKEFTKNRTIVDGTKNINRLYVVEQTPSSTGSLADTKLNLSTSEIRKIVIALANELGVISKHVDLNKEEAKFLHVLVGDLKHYRSQSIVLAGTHLPSDIQSLAYAINEKLGNVGKTTKHIKPIEANAEINNASLKSLTKDIIAGKVETIFILNTNPVYTAPADLSFKQALNTVKNIVHYGLYKDETAAMAHWHIPGTHYLEHFSDGRASDGTLTMVQPLIKPLYGAKSIHEFLDLLNGSSREGLEIVQESFKNLTGSSNLANNWRKALHNGFAAKSAFAPASATAKAPKSIAAIDTELELQLLADPTIWDGQFSNNGWLQELAKPFSKLTWDNAAYVSPKLAEHMHLQNGDLIKINASGTSIQLPIWIVPGQAEKTITTFLGYGRKNIGAVANDKGFNTYKLLFSSSPYSIANVKADKTGNSYKLVSTQLHQSMHGRNLVRTTDYEDYKHHPDFAQAHGAHGSPALFHPHPWKARHAWGMTVNLNTCTGCNACVTACQSENNIPVVGKKEVSRGREMAWIRIDQYYQGNIDNPETHSQPMMCMHCENAPCEPVCPVGATGHSDEGINEMAYNRCVGTRYCSNNCPYKVRRFNFFQFADKKTKTYQLMYNPDVTVRNRGVMEKCTFCVQRVNQARITAEKENRTIRDGEVVTACQQVCPTNAISFGNLKDENSDVSKKKHSKLNYGLLTELNTNPRVTYLAKVKNPNPELIAKKSNKAHHQGASH